MIKRKSKMFNRSAEIAYAHESVILLHKGIAPDDIGLSLEKCRRILMKDIKKARDIHAEYSIKLNMITNDPPALWNVDRIAQMENQDQALNIRWTKFQLQDQGPQAFIQYILHQVESELTRFIQEKRS